jgi:opacity protein-like surface antigen
MTKSFVSCALATLVLSVAGAAKAQAAGGAANGSSCPPGSWFCAEAPQQHAAPAGQPVGLEPLPDPDAAPPRTVPPPPPVVVYQPPPPTMVVRPESPPPYEYEAPPRETISRAREWGLNVHLDWAAIGRGAGGDAAMGGAGAGLRFKPTRRFGIEGDLDFVGGRDYLANRRNETALMFNALLYLNPKSRAQVYLLAGLGWSWAHTRCDEAMTSCPGAPLDAHYSYFGGQLGGGIEIRLSHSFAFNVDLRGFIRGRTDDLAQRQPEFTDAAGRTTNTSGGGLLTGGMTLYF